MYEGGTASGTEWNGLSVDGTYSPGTELSVGVGFGLFGLFSLLRYRTNTLPTREMTYLFIIIALPVMNSILITNEAWPALLLANTVVVAELEEYFAPEPTPERWDGS